jgi:uncharacterized 2Fe-2S/4Fe-4S cluster protein (DUF4445 family)
MSIEDNDILLSVIGEGDPLGICGSGLIDIVAQLLNASIINKNGKLILKEDAENIGIPSFLSDRILKTQKGNSFVLFNDGKGNIVSITQKDIREVQLAKGAILAGIGIMMEQLELESAQIDRILLAGAFGNYINKESALTIGLFPKVDLDKIIPIGNAAGLGASMALLSKISSEKADQLAKEIRHIELAEHEDFQKIFLKAMYF